MELKARTIETSTEQAEHKASEDPIKRYAEEILAEFGDRRLHPYEQSPLDDLARLYAVIAQMESYKRAMKRLKK